VSFDASANARARDDDDDENDDDDARGRTGDERGNARREHFEGESDDEASEWALEALRAALETTLRDGGGARTKERATTNRDGRRAKVTSYRAASRTYEGERVDREREASAGAEPASMRRARDERRATVDDMNRSDEEVDVQAGSAGKKWNDARNGDQRESMAKAEDDEVARAKRAGGKEQKKDSTRWTAPKEDSYESKLDRLLLVAERAGLSAERFKEEITDLGRRVENSVVVVQPWENKGNAWAGERSKSAHSERSSSAGTILNPKGLTPKRADRESPKVPIAEVEPKVVVTSILRSDLVRAMGEMSADEKLSRLGLKSVPENEHQRDEAIEYAAGTPASHGRSLSTPGSQRRAWSERSPRSATNYDDYGDDFGDGDHFLTPPAPASSLKSQKQTYVDKLKAQAKVAKLDSSRSWKAGVGVVSGQL